MYYAFDLSTETTALYGHMQQWSYFNSLVIYSLMFVILWDPAAVFIKKLFSYIIDGNSNDQEENDPQVGRIIGKLERIIVSVLILYNQFGAIGFVLIAKSIARYKQLEDKNFAEKYLVGTLTSAAIAFITTYCSKRIFIIGSSCINWAPSSVQYGIIFRRYSRLRSRMPSVFYARFTAADGAKLILITTILGVRFS